MWIVRGFNGDIMGFEEEMDVKGEGVVDTTPKEPEEARETEQLTETTGQAEVPKEEEVAEEEELGLPFPNAAVVRLMKANLDKDKMVKKEAKLAMNKWLGELCAKVARVMNKNPYVMMGQYEFIQAKRVFDDLEAFSREKERILAHLEAIVHDIDKLKRDLGAFEESEELK